MPIGAIAELMTGGGVCLSFEVFPPKQAENFEAVSRAALEIAALQPSFMSVTYGAGGTTDRYTLAVAQEIQEKHGLPALAHLTCIGADRAGVRARLEILRAAGVRNIMALRGDLPEGQMPASDYPYAADLVAEIKAFGGFCVGAACYPEGHVECGSPAEDRRNLKKKVDAGADFLTTQMFFDNDLLYKFLYQIREIGISAPVAAGIMPVTNGRQIARICRLSGTYLPARFRAIVDQYGDSPAAMQQAGIVYACEQIVDLLASGVNAIHVYSMNKPAVAAAIRDNLKHLIGECAC
ncbi:MAG: methylenetetrahydrofolate reductase [Oscillospiraceae bacterium]|jgi:methylenetetrahydrofolate reductase (NADPH)|nr:methylenetetrahydrofolate reductase [Oscillospiraceae bacterium]